MPTYDYECQDCGYQFEINHSIHDDALTVCPECLEPKLLRLISSNIHVMVKNYRSHVSAPGAHAEQWKKDRHAREMAAIAAEPMTESEQQAAYEQGIEREKEMGFKEGHASGHRQPIISSNERPHLTKAEVDARISAAKAAGHQRIARAKDERKRVV